MTEKSSPTWAIADFTSKLSFKGIPEPAVRLAKMCFLDWLGSALAGSQQKPAKIAVEIIRRMGGVPESTIVAYGDKTSCVNASLTNGLMSHIIEMDDVHKAALLHPGVSTIPAALAVAETTRATGQALITAIVVGYEATIRVGEAVNPAHYEYWHTTGTCGTFGAAMAAGKLLGLSREGLVNALGSAGTQAAGLWEFIRDGAMSKHLHAGKAAANGVFSALLSERGFTGATSILEGERGFCRATSSKYDLNKVTDDLGKSFKITETSFKPHASCRYTHPTIDAALKIYRKARIRPERIKKIRVKTFEMATKIACHNNPKTAFEAKFSVPYSAAIALIKGQAGLNEFTEELLNASVVQKLMEKVDVTIDPVLNNQYPTKWPALLEVETKDEKKYSASVDYPLGDPENPISEGEIQNKFRILASPVLTPEKIENVIELINNLEKVMEIQSVFQHITI